MEMSLRNILDKDFARYFFLFNDTCYTNALLIHNLPNFLDLFIYDFEICISLLTTF